MGYATVLSEAELHVGTASVTLPLARTFDWYLVQGGVQAVNMGHSHAQLLQMAEHKLMAYTMPVAGTFDVTTVWKDLKGYSTEDELPNADERNRRTEPVTFTCTLSTSLMDDERSALVEMVSTAGTRNVRDIYVVTEEALGSGKKLRTYFDVWANTQLTYLPKSFFDIERKCFNKMAKVLDYVRAQVVEVGVRSPPARHLTLRGR